MSRFQNRLGIVFFKEFPESSIYDESAKLPLAKLISLSDQILEEEFLDSKILKINHDNLHKRVKLGLFVLKHNKKIEENEVKDVDLNCTMVRTMDPSSVTTQLSSLIKLEEVVLYDSYVAYLKCFLKQIIN